MFPVRLRRQKRKQSAGYMKQFPAALPVVACNKNKNHDKRMSSTRPLKVYLRIPMVSKC